MRQNHLDRVLACAALLAATGGLCQAAETPHEWLDRMAGAVQATSYEGTVIRQREGKTESLRVAHTIVDGVVHERVVAQEGSGLEIVRNGNEVYCILPDKRTVLVEQWNDQSTLFSTLPSSDLRFGNEYDLVIKRKARVAGRMALEIAIQPHDNYRYGHRLWLDTETGFPLETQLIGDDGQPLEQVRFVEINLDTELAAQALSTSHQIDGFTWFTEPGRPPRREVESDWVADELPVGFFRVSAEEEMLGANDVQEAGHAEHGDRLLTHIMYSDGLANVSAFIVASDEAKPAESTRKRMGATHSFTTARDGARITVVGEVPAVTVERIGRSLRRR
ncbi:MAG: MucB/RseB C-terminal domain-containing protein [Pseudomonadota bacterium]